MHDPALDPSLCVPTMHRTAVVEFGGVVQNVVFRIRLHSIHGAWGKVMISETAGFAWTEDLFLGLMSCPWNLRQILCRQQNEGRPIRPLD